MPSTTRPSDQPPSAMPEDVDDVMAPEMTEEEAARARPIAEAPASLFAALPKNKGGRPRSAAPKEHVSLRVDADVLSAYKATGEGWQSRMNEALRLGMSRIRQMT